MPVSGSARVEKQFWPEFFLRRFDRIFAVLTALKAEFLDAFALKFLLAAISAVVF